MSDPKWTIELTKACLKDLKKLDHGVQKRILAYFRERLAKMDTPKDLGKPLSHDLQGLWRFRIAGSYRAICEVHDQRLVILVLGVGHRKDVYT